MKKMAISYMVSNGNGHYLQRRIPKDLLPHYPEKRSGIIKRYLGRDKAAAKKKLVVLLAELEAEWAAKQKGGGGIVDLSDKEIERLTAIWTHNCLDEDEQARLDGSEELYANIHDQFVEPGVPFACAAPPERDVVGMSEREYAKRAETLEFTKGYYGHALARGRIDVIEEELDDLLNSEGIVVSKNSPSYRKLALSILKATVKATEIEERRHAGEAIDTPPMPAKTHRNGPVKTGGDGPLISEIFEKWKAERKPRAKTASDFGTYIQRFIEVNGDCPVIAIGKREIVAFKDAMLAYPVRLGGKLHGKTVPEVIKDLESDTVTPRLSARTVNDKALGAIGAILGYAASNAYCETNAAHGVKVDTGDTIEDPRLPYSVADMNLIFSFPIYSQGDLAEAPDPADQLHPERLIADEPSRVQLPHHVHGKRRLHDLIGLDRSGDFDDAFAGPDLQADHGSSAIVGADDTLAVFDQSAPVPGDHLEEWTVRVLSLALAHELHVWSQFLLADAALAGIAVASLG